MGWWRGGLSFELHIYYDDDDDVDDDDDDDDVC